MSFFGVMDQRFAEAGRMFSKADQSRRARLIQMHITPASSVSDVEAVGRQIDEFDKLIAPFFTAIIELNRAAEAYVFAPSESWDAAPRPVIPETPPRSGC